MPTIPAPTTSNPAATAATAEGSVEAEPSEDLIQSVMDATGQGRMSAIHALKAYGSVVDSIMALCE